MKRSSVLSRVFFRRAAVKALVPDLKLVLVVLTIGCESHVGVYRPAGLGEDTGLDPSALVGALADLERHNHILPDAGTGEIFVTAFFRDNSFSTTARRGQARDDFAQIESSKLRLAVLKAIDQNPSCGLKSVDLLHNQENQTLASQGEGKVKGEGEAAAPRAYARGTDSAAATATTGKRRTRRPSGIVTWLPADVQEAEFIERQYASDDIAAAVAVLRAINKQPVPGLIQQQIEQQQRERDAAVRRAQEDAELRVRAISEIDPAAQAKGQQLLPATLRARFPKTTTTKEATA